MGEGLANRALHRTPDTLLMPSMSLGYEDSVKPYGLRGGGFECSTFKEYFIKQSKTDNHLLKALFPRDNHARGCFFCRGGSVLLIYKQRYASMQLMDEQRLGSELLCSSRLRQNFIVFYDPQSFFSSAKTTQSPT